MSNATAQEPFTVVLPAPKLSKGEREYQAFLRLLPKLLETHAGKYVAIHDEQVVDSGDDRIELVHRVHDRVGYVPIHVGLVVFPQPLYRIPHYRLYRPEIET